MKVSFEFLNFLVICDDDDVGKDSLWALSSAVESSVEFGNLILQGKVIAFIFNGLDNLVKRLNDLESSNVLGINTNFLWMPILRLLGNIITGTDEQTGFLIAYNDNILMKYSYEIFYKYDEQYKLARVRKEICWILSNIVAGTKQQVDILIKCNIHSLLIDSLQNTKLHVKNESCHAIFNLLQRLEKDPSINKIVGSDLVMSLFYFLEIVNDIQFKVFVLTCYMLILETGDFYGKKKGKVNGVIEFFDNRVVEFIEDFQMSDDDEVHLMA